MEDDKLDIEKEAIQSEDQATEVDAEALFNEAIGETEAQAADESAVAEAEQEARPEEKPAEEKKEDDPETLQKRLSDTQRWGHELSAKVAELEKTLSELKSRQEQPKQEEELPEDIRVFYEEYPELPKAIQAEVERRLKAVTGGKDLANALKEIEDSRAQMSFERSVVNGVTGKDGQFVEGHPDAYRIMATQDFKSWLTEETKKDPKVADTMDPIEAIGILSRYKEEKTKAATAVQKTAQQEAAAQMKEFASGGVPQGNRGRASPRKAQEDDPERLFELGAGIVR